MCKCIRSFKANWWKFQIQQGNRRCKLSRRIGAASWWVSLSIHHDVKYVLPPLSYFEYTPISCCLLLAIMYKNCVVIKPEVHIISQRLQRSHDLS